MVSGHAPIIPFHLSSVQIIHLSLSPANSILGRQGLNVPDHIRILLNAPIATEEAHPAHAGDALANPLILILVGLIHKRMRLDVAVEVIADEIEIAVIDDGVAEGGEAAGVAEHATFDGAEDFLEVLVELEGTIGVGVAEVFNVFSEVAEEEDVVFADLACDLNLGLCQLLLD